MKKIYQFSLLLLFTSVLACEKTITLETDLNQEQVVVEGLITNSELNYVRLTKSRDFYASGSIEGILSADVTVSDNEGNIRRYVHNPGNVPGLDGVYLPEVPYTPSVGLTYTLEALVEGTTYMAQETLLPVTTIDSLVVTLDVEEQADPEDEGRFYEILFYAQEPQDRVDNYLFKFYRNGELIKDFEEDIYFGEDEYLGEQIDDLPIAGYYALGDTVMVEMYSITREAFVYYSDLFNLINNDGGMFSPPPANPRSNVSNGALGYFQVSAIDTETIIVEEPDGD